MAKKDDGDLMDLWVKYKEHGDVQARNAIIIHYSSLVNRIVNRIIYKYKDYIDYDDLVSYGIFGLIDAINKFDINKGIKFETYGSYRIRGAIVDQIRELDWIPRNLRTKAKNIEEAFEKLEMKLGRQASELEIAQYLGMGLDELQKSMGEIHTFSILSLDEQIMKAMGNSIHFKSNRATPEEDLVVEDIKNGLSQAINLLDENEKNIINLYYFEELTLREIGGIIGVSESRVSQIHSRSLIKLKNKLNKGIMI